MVSSYTTNKNIEKPASGDYPGTWATPINANWDLIDSALGATLNLSGLASSNVTLTRTQASNLIIKCTGILTANIQITFPAYGGLWVVSNETTGSFTITIACAGGGTSVTAASAARTIIMTDGTNARIADDRVSSFSLTSSAMDGLFGSTQGNIVYRGASSWAALGPGTSGQYLKTQGAAANPTWATVSAGVGTITGVTAGDGLTGGGSSGGVTLDVGAGNGISVAANTVDVICPVWSFGRVANGGTLQNGYYCSTSKTATGTYSVTFSSAASSAQYAILITSSTGISGGYSSQTANGFTVTLRATTTGTNTDAEWSFVTFGG